MPAKTEGKSAETRNTIAVVERAFFVLQVVAASDEALGVREIARRTDLSPATALRLARTLEALDMVERRPDGQIVLGTGVGSLTGDRPAAPGADRFVALLARLVDTFGEGATAAIDDGAETLFLAHVAPDSAVQVADVTGDRWPAHTTASGVVLMGAWDDDRLSSYVAGDLSWDAPKTITDPAQLERRVRQAKADGFAWSVEELVADASGIAVPVTSDNGQVIAAVGLYAPTYRLHPDRADVADLPHRLIAVVNRLSSAVTSGLA